MKLKYNKHSELYDVAECEIINSCCPEPDEDCKTCKLNLVYSEYEDRAKQKFCEMKEGE